MNVLESIIDRIPIDKGWSGDQKYCAVAALNHSLWREIRGMQQAAQVMQWYDRMKTVIPNWYQCQ